MSTDWVMSWLLAFRCYQLSILLLNHSVHSFIRLIINAQIVIRTLSFQLRVVGLTNVFQNLIWSNGFFNIFFYLILASHKNPRTTHKNDLHVSNKEIEVLIRIRRQKINIHSIIHHKNEYTYVFRSQHINSIFYLNSKICLP